MPSRSWTIKPLIDVTADYLRQKGVHSPRLDAELLLAHLLRCRRLDLYLRFDQPLEEEEIVRYRTLVRRRAAREPLQYIRGREEFWSLDFEVGPGVLIPRPETEGLVEKALALDREDALSGGGTPRILDLGTGSGVLAVCMAREMPRARICASDVSRSALNLARRNARRHGVEARISWVLGDGLAPFRAVEGDGFDLILVNPPYVAEQDFDGLQPEVRDYEPREALDGGPGGMIVARRVLREALSCLAPGGRILVELDPSQMDEARKTALSTGRYAHTEVVPDYTGRPRIFSALAPSSQAFPEGR